MKTSTTGAILAVLLIPLAQAAEPQFAGIALDLNRPWAARHDMTSQSYAADFQKRRSDGYRLYCVTAYPKDGTVKFAAVWIKDGSHAVSWSAFHDQTPDQYQRTFNEMKAKGMRPRHVTGYMVGGSHRLASIFANDGVTDWIAEHDQPDERHQQVLSEWQAKGYRPICTSAYPTKSGTRFALVMEKNNKKYDWEARRNLSKEEHQQEFTKWTGQGYRPTQVCGYPRSSNSITIGARYSSLFLKGGPQVRFSTRHGISETEYQNWITSLEKDKLVPVYVSAYAASGFVAPTPESLLFPMPMSGTNVPELTAYDDAMQKYMRTRGIKAGTLAVMHNGHLVLSRGYGWLDSSEKRPCTPETPMRIASVSKPITKAAVSKLIRDGKLNADTKVFSLLGTKPPPGQTMDKRLLNITVQHLLDHKGGWAKNDSTDPMLYKSLEIATALGQTGPASASDIVRYMAGQPLDFDPGSKEAYSNFGYCVLGRVVEKVSKKSYIDYVKSEVAPRALKSIQLGRTLPKNRNPAEPIYRSNADGGKTNVMEPGSNVIVPTPDGGFCLEAMDSHGGLVASAPDLVRFFQAYWMDGSVRKGGSMPSSGFFGNLPGNFSFVSQRSDGVNFAVLFNQRGKTPNEYQDIAAVLNKVTDGIKSWPK